MTEVFAGSTQQERLAQAYAQVSGLCKASQDLESIKANGSQYPALAQRHLSGAEAWLRR